ncbi:type II toxin-antitoxin system RelE/ParE family toxin [Gemmatimonadota bacterium]
MEPSLKPVLFEGSSREGIRSFPPKARREAGYQLYRLQQGLPLSDAKPLRGVGRGVFEIRIHVEGEYRVVYLARHPEAVYVLHAFTKKTRRTPQRDLDLVRERVREVNRGRSGAGGRAQKE